MTHEERANKLFYASGGSFVDGATFELLKQITELSDRIDALEAKPDPRATAEREVLGTLA